MGRAVVNFFINSVLEHINNAIDINQSDDKNKGMTISKQ